MSALLSACASTTQPTAPNVVLILVDDMGWSDLGSFGGEIDTPQLDALAENGLRFTQFHTTSKCFPSRAALLTGLYAEQVGLDTSPRATMERGVTIAEALKPAGYRTFMVGKHHATDNPADRGFDRYVGLRDGASNQFNPGTTARAGEPEPARKWDRVKEGRMWCFDQACLRGFRPEDPDFYTTDFYTDQAIEFLDETSDSERPFFLYIAYQAPHDPLQAWPEDIEKYAGRYDEGFREVADARYERMLTLGVIDDSFPRPPADHREWRSLSETERAELSRKMAVYAAMTDRIDQNLEKLLRFLEDSRELDNTLILFTSDNGASAELVLDIDGENEIGAEHPIGTVGRWASLGGDWANVSNTPFRKYKNFSYEGGTASPLILHWPAGIADPGRIVSANTHLIDIFPTLLDVSGADYPSRQADGKAAPALEGMSLRPYLSSSETVERGVPVFQRWQHGRSVRTERWKLLSWDASAASPEDGEWKLFDTTVDKTETRDVARSHPGVVEELSDAYDAWLARVKPDL